MYFCATAQTKKRAEVAKEKILFPGNRFLNPLLMAAFAAGFILCFSSLRGKVAAEAERWQKEASFEVTRLEYANKVELADIKAGSGR